MANYQKYSHQYLSAVTIPNILGLGNSIPQKIKDYAARISGPPWNGLCSGYCSGYLRDTYRAFGTTESSAQYLSVVAAPSSGFEGIIVTLTATAIGFTPTGNVDFDCNGDGTFEVQDSGSPYTVTCPALPAGSYTLRATADGITGSDQVNIQPPLSLDVLRVEIWDAAGGSDEIDDYINSMENGNSYDQACLAAYPIVDAGCGGMRYDWTPPNSSKIFNARRELQQPFGIPGESGMHDPSTPDLRCDSPIGASGIPFQEPGTHVVSFTCCSEAYQSDGSCLGTEGDTFTRSITINGNVELNRPVPPVIVD